MFDMFSVYQALTSTAVKKGGLLAGDVATLYKYKNTTFDVKVDTESNVCCFLKLKKTPPACRLFQISILLSHFILTDFSNLDVHRLASINKDCCFDQIT